MLMKVLKKLKGIKKIETLEEYIRLERKKFPGKKIRVSSDYDTRSYELEVLNEDETSHFIEVPVFLETQVVYGDTDSVMCRFKYNRNDLKLNRYDSFRLAKIAGVCLTRDIFARAPIEMEFEKVFNPFLLKGKKNYVGKKFDDMSDPMRMTKLHTAGVASTRRNYNEFYKRYAEKIYDCFLENSLNDIIQLTRECLDDIEGYNIGWDDLMISSSLAGSYKQMNMPHLTVVKKKRERKEDVQVGDRVSFVFVENDSSKAQKYEKAEDPVYARENNLKFDRVVYIEHIAKPILGFMVPLLHRERPKLLSQVFDLINEYLVRCGGKKLTPGTIVFKE